MFIIEAWWNLIGFILFFGVIATAIYNAGRLDKEADDADVVTEMAFEYHRPVQSKGCSFIYPGSDGQVEIGRIQG
ncbi:hypothetical protein [Paenibacillus glucanolyticus]|uniref:hypothetical protein n=1 Tax=Paenibacillus glucanolyticus TaxID=59843 RepID=UPI0034CD36E3